MEFKVNQIFIGEYPPEAAEYCNSNGLFIEEIEADEEGNRRFQIKSIPEPTTEELEAQALATLKSERADAVSKLTVEVDGLVFDADETSQDRMSRTIVALPEGTKMPWVLADNSIVEITADQLREALQKAGLAQAALWVKPYTEG